MNPMVHDAQLVAAAQGGDKAAFETLLTRHRPMLLALCRRAVGNEGFAEDAAQEAMLLAMLNLDRLRRADRFGPWLTGIGLNVCHRWRRQRSRDAWSWDAMLGGVIAEPVDPSPSPEDRAEADELRDWVQRVVAELPPGQRAAVVLHYLMGLPQAETASLLGIEVRAVKMRLHKARANLRQRLWAEPAIARTEEEQVMIEMRVVDVRRRREPVGKEPRVRHIVLLKEVDGTRSLTIWIGEFEATALALQLDGTDAPRPMTYAFATALFQAAGGRLREVRVDRLVGEVFYATAVVAGPDADREIDARPSDVFNLALLLQAPIRVAPEVLEATDPSRCGEDWTNAETYSEGAAAIVAGITSGWSTPDVESPLGAASEES